MFPEFCYTLYIFICLHVDECPNCSIPSVEFMSLLNFKPIEWLSSAQFSLWRQVVTLPGLSVAVLPILKWNFMHMHFPLKSIIEVKSLMALRMILMLTLPLRSDTSFAFQNNRKWWQIVFAHHLAKELCVSYGNITLQPDWEFFDHIS
jgi:hypothetical protein